MSDILGGGSDSLGGSSDSLSGGSDVFTGGSDVFSNVVNDGFPNASNTGVPVGTSLTTVNPPGGFLTLNTPGQIYEDKLVNGYLVIEAANITVRRCKIIPPTALDINAIFNNNTGLIVEDCEIVLSGRKMTGITPQNYTARRCNIYGGENLLWVDTNVTIEDCYIHDPVNYNPIDDPHTDCIQFGETVSSNVIVRRNTLLGNFVIPESGPGAGDGNFGSSAVQVGDNPTNVQITNNKFGGAGYCLRVQKAVTHTGLVVTGNRWSNEACAARGYPNIYAGFGPDDGFRANVDTWNDNKYLNGPLAGQNV